MTPQIFTLSAISGSLVLAIWVFACLPRLRPSTLKVAVVNVVASFAVFHLGPTLIVVCGHVAPPLVAVAMAVALVTLPLLTYMYVSWIWLLGVIAKHLSGRPRGGHLVRSGA
jgi:hypothetical protein